MGATLIIDKRLASFDVKLNTRIIPFIFFIIGTSIAIQYFGLPAWVLPMGVDFLISFLISGALYTLLSANGFGFLNEIKLRHSLSAMTVTVFLLKHLLL